MVLIEDFYLPNVGTSTASPDTMKPEASQGVHSELFADRNDDEFAAQKQNAKAPNRTGFPKAALLLVDALKKNRACQKLIRRKLVNIEAKIEENKDLGDRVKCLLGYQLSCRKSTGRTLSQKEDPRVRLISSRKPTRLSEKVLYIHLRIGCCLMRITALGYKHCLILLSPIIIHPPKSTHGKVSLD